MQPQIKKKRFKWRGGGGEEEEGRRGGEVVHFQKEKEKRSERILVCSSIICRQSHASAWPHATLHKEKPGEGEGDEEGEEEEGRLSCECKPIPDVQES